MSQSGESASLLSTEQAALDAVKAFVRMHRARLAADGELLALLMPERVFGPTISDMQRFALEKLAAEARTLRLERDALKRIHDRKANLSEVLRRAVLDLIGAGGLAEVLAVARAAAPGFGAEIAAFCVETAAVAPVPAHEAIRAVPPGTVNAVVGPEGMGAILSGGGELLFGRTGYRSIAAFRLRIGHHTPQALFVLGSLAEGRFEGRICEADLGYFARALERAIRAWLDLPKS